MSDFEGLFFAAGKRVKHCDLNLDPNCSHCWKQSIWLASLAFSSHLFLEEKKPVYVYQRMSL